MFFVASCRTRCRAKHGAGNLTYSIVVEMENAKSINEDEIGVSFSALAREIKAVTTTGQYLKPEVIVVHSGPDTDTPILRHRLTEIVPQLGMAANTVFSACTGGRYYEVKNAGAALAKGDIVIFCDSDTVIEDGWLSALLKPLQDPKTIAVNGYTYLGCDDFASRTFALLWFFPLRDGDRRFASKRAMNANNCAFRRSWLAGHPFPASNGFKVSCTLLTSQLRASGHDFVRVDARASHYPPRGWRFFFWRALVTGRDADRKYVALASPSQAARVLKATRRWFSTSWKVGGRILTHATRLGMPAWQIPFALIVGLAFCALVFCAQAAMALGLVRDKVENVPLYVGHS
ncbi:MAG: glycosyltransferase [Mesorhizobium sp.]|nr:glycosyltransferase [Mesorhizobium sp. M7A.F.Ca.MR.176.00.0.0]RVD12860.1 glycosyltransferase [Mesorhizobium sp. M7A.F.Ca.ET.027.02.1.1]RVD65049.1 glycosyltransferase [Mesorhizobium sp. M7A.F.Ca.ET.027.03.2.1]RWC99341.1 MAG: glycosyltransferase [Mesorhizobium sp.]RWP12092.1 MAG: glycosyltransferase [Mesorhizobium sp.]